MKYLVEFIGTFFLVTTIGVTGIPGGDLLRPVAIGVMLMVMVYAGGHVSGAHYNPAVTLAVFLRGRCPIVDVPIYMIAQVLAAVAAAGVVFVLRGAPSGAPGGVGDQWLRALVAEALWTFALAYVVLNVATAKATANNSFYGMAIGFTVLTGAITVGAISKGVFNPAVAVGITVMGLAPISDIWIYLVADFAGAAVAGILFKIINPNDP